MLELRPNCETCDKDLPPSEQGAMICSFECTFCTTCANDKHDQHCPNCRGQLSPRPTRATTLLSKYPASTKRILNTGA